MIIIWSTEYRITNDDYNWIVEKRKGSRKRNGRSVANWKQVAFFQDFYRCFGYMLSNEIQALPVEIPANPGCELILNLKNEHMKRLDQLEGLFGAQKPADWPSSIIKLDVD